ncbi:MAG: hypothetical protein VCE12_07900, partial [Candidatus Latescibacterota bacterium]
RTRWDVARCVFPLVYQGDGVISDAGRHRFGRVCESLGLPKDAPRTISRNYRQGLDGQWARLRRLVTGLNYFAEVMVFDLRELETVRDLLERLSRFDPRRPAGPTGTGHRILDFSTALSRRHHW